MGITKEFLLGELARMTQQRNHAHDVVVAHQAAMDVLESLINRLDAPTQKDTTFADLGLPDPQPLPTL